MIGLNQHLNLKNSLISKIIQWKKLECFVNIKFAICNEIVYGYVVGETTSCAETGRKFFGDLEFAEGIKEADEEENGPAKIILGNNDDLDWYRKKIIVIPTSCKGESRRLEGKLAFDLNLFES